ncbi:K(+)-transporting ATPase subunit F [Granulicella cerasi]|uniref:K(+)-transporting ATPase subunit F n=1 Tax=Granulicella cerasi TaxID=741063 RepID=A0ABW1Z622_9BACT
MACNASIGAEANLCCSLKFHPDSTHHAVSLLPLSRYRCRLAAATSANLQPVRKESLRHDGPDLCCLHRLAFRRCICLPPWLRHVERNSTVILNATLLLLSALLLIYLVYALLRPEKF